MKLKWTKTCASFCLAILLLSAGASEVLAAAGTEMQAAQIKDKEEVVYANLTTSGAVDHVYVVNQFEVTTAGQLTDYGSYAAVSNLTSTEPLSQSGDAVQVPVDRGNFYCQGTLTNTGLPWDFSISYSLDGTPLSAQELGGQSGELAIHITSKPNSAANAVFYDNYMLQVSLTMDADKCRNIVSADATIANSGKNKVVTHTVMPGKNANITVFANVENFAMDGIQIAAMPFNMSVDMPDTDEMTDEMTSLSDAVAALHKGIGKLADGADELADGAGQLAEGSGQFQAGLSQLSGGSGELVGGSQQIGAALNTFAEKLSGSSATEESAQQLDISSLKQLPAALTELSDGLYAVSGGLVQMRDGFAQAYSALDAAIAAIPGDQVDPSGLYGLVTPGSAEETALNQLVANYAAAQTVRGTYYGPNGNDGVKSAFDAVGTTVTTLTDPTSKESINYMAAGLATMATQMGKALENFDTSSLEQLTAGLVALAAEYNKFHNGLVQYTDGVQAVSSGYGQLNSGIAALSSGSAQFADGANQLYSGSGELNDAVADLPDTMQVEIDELMADYEGGDFSPISFVSSKNANTALVQFVCVTPAIEDPTEDVQAVQPEAESGLWDRVKGLFS